MKFRISKEKFLEGLQQVQNVVSSRATLPILSNVLLEADGGFLRMTTTDLDVTKSMGFFGNYGMNTQSSSAHRPVGLERKRNP